MYKIIVLFEFCRYQGIVHKLNNYFCAFKIQVSATNSSPTKFLLCLFNHSHVKIHANIIRVKAVIYQYINTYMEDFFINLRTNKNSFSIQ